MSRLMIVIGLFLTLSCRQNTDQTNNKVDSGEVLSAEQQSKLSPDDIISLLKSGNNRFVEDDKTARDHRAQIRKSVSGQFPKAIVLSCVDSRVPVEDVFDLGIGDIFVARVAGNFVNSDILGSMEFATKVSGAKLILVLGHEHCGAIKASIDNVRMGNITSLVESIQPAVKITELTNGEKSSKNEAFVHAVCENNIKNTIKNIREKSSILKEMEDSGDIKIIGAIYNMSTGKVDFNL